jgi:hypothetical protein
MDNRIDVELHDGLNKVDIKSFLSFEISFSG